MSRPVRKHSEAMCLVADICSVIKIPKHIISNTKTGALSIHLHDKLQCKHCTQSAHVFMCAILHTYVYAYVRVCMSFRIPKADHFLFIRTANSNANTVRVCTRVYVRESCIRTCMHVTISLRMVQCFPAHAHVSVLYICTCVHIYIYMYVCMYVYTYIYICIYIHIYIYMYIYTYIYAHVSVRMYIYTKHGVCI